MSFDTKCHSAKASGGKEASGLAEAAGIVAGSNFVARIADAVIAFADTESVEQSSEIESRQLKQMSARTAIGISVASVVAGIAIEIAANIVAGVTIEADVVARTTIGNTTTVQAETAEQVLERSELRCAATIIEATIGKTARIAIDDNAARITTIVIGVARAACLIGKQVTQTSAQSAAGQTANFVARIASDDIVARIASDNGFTGIAVIDADTADQSLKTAEQVAASHYASVTSSARIKAR